MNIIPIILAIAAGEPAPQIFPPSPSLVVASTVKQKPKQEPYLNCFFTKDNVYKCVP